MPGTAMYFDTDTPMMLVVAKTSWMIAKIQTCRFVRIRVASDFSAQRDRAPMCASVLSAPA